MTSDVQAERGAGGGSQTAVCCFCGDKVDRDAALRLTVSRDGVKAIQFLWAHVAHLEDAIAASGIELLDDALRNGPAT